MSSRLPVQRWRIAQTDTDKVNLLVQSTGLSPLMAQVLINREITTPELAEVYINPESQSLPLPSEEFPDLEKSVDLLVSAIENGESIAICGDYDADGMTSTALLIRALRHLGALVDYAIPSRMTEGYGINERIVEEFAESGVGLILTVDNGIAAHEPIALAIDLGMSVIVTDHHDLPPTLPVADAILNPKLLPPSSPYSGLAGVGVAYVLAVTTAQRLGKLKGLTDQLLELFTLGTIADLAPLVGVNRRWLKRGLKRLPKSNIAGIQALMAVGNIDLEKKQLNPDDIGFQLGPRINAVGRIGDPQAVIELLTTEDLVIAEKRAIECEQTNRKRQQLCEEIEREAIEIIEKTPIDWQGDRVLLIVHHNWHHGVIGIVASRLLERYGVPVFIGTYEDEHHIRGSARGIDEFNVFEALEYCRDVLGKAGGHKMAGGFSLPSKNLELFRGKLKEFAHQLLKPEHLKPLIKIDAPANFKDLTPRLYQQIESLQPWGIANQIPCFWTPNVRVLEQQIIGKNHVKLTLAQDDNTQIKAVAWRWAIYFPLPSRIDVAYKLRQNVWNDNVSLELELMGVRLPADGEVIKGKFEHEGRFYSCSYWPSLQEIRIKNQEGKVLAVRKGQRIGLLGMNRENCQEVEVTKPQYYGLIKTAMKVLNL